MLLPVVYSLAASLSWGIADFGAGLKSRMLPLVATRQQTHLRTFFCRLI